MTVRIDWWGMSDEALKAECEEDRFRGSGPGGQHRNKTDSGIRLRHRTTGITVTATERRSQHENRARAFARLRAALAFDLRQADPPIPPPTELAPLLAADRPIVSTKNAAFLPLAAYLLDVVDASGGQVSTAAERVGISTARLLKQLGDPEEAWQALNRLRQRHGLPSLKR